jgi:ribosomal protein S18 acetylase RimI-like enzyme
MIRYDVLATHHVNGLSGDDIADLNYLLAQVSIGAEPLTRESLGHILEQSLLVVAQAFTDDESRIVGMGFSSPVRTGSGLRMHLNDIVVTAEHRGQGLARRIVGTLLEHARRDGARSADLTSNPGREAANELYRDIGFKLRETNVYRFVFPDNESPA